MSLVDGRGARRKPLQREMTTLTRSGSTRTPATAETAAASAGEHPDDMSLDAPPAPRTETRCRPASALCPYPIGHDDAIAAVKPDMNVSDPDRGYLPSRS
jgi:hypothetical protein